MSRIPAITRKGLAAFHKFGVLPVLRHAFGRIRRHGVHAVLSDIHASPALEKPPANRHDYTEWIRRYDTRTPAEREKLRSQIDSLPAKPVLSVLVAAKDGWTPDSLLETVASIRQQVYPCWEILIAETTTLSETIRASVKSVTQQDPRIKLLIPTTPGNPCAAMNRAIDHAAGDWIFFLGPGILLAEHAFFYIVQAALGEPDTAFIYTDDDRIDTQGNRHSPTFKPDWDEALFFSRHLHLPLCVFRKSLLNAREGLRPAFDPAGEYDLILRCLEHIRPEAIRHIPRILCHRQDAPATTAPPELRRQAERAAERKALCDHLTRMKVDCSVEVLGDGYRLRYRLPQPPPRVSIIIPVRNGHALFRTCIKSILSKSTYPDFELLIVDNGSDEPAMLDYLVELEKDPRIRILRDPRPFNYSALNNRAATLATGELLALVNSDIEVITPSWLEEMVALAVLPGTGAVGASLWYPTDTLQHGGVILGIKGVAAHAPKGLPREAVKALKYVFCLRAVSAVTGACLVVKRKHYQAVSGLNETDLAVAFNDIDFCLKLLQKGYRNLWTPDAELYHHESASRGEEDTTQKRKRFSGEIAYMQKHWGNLLTHDPAYNPNLTLEGEDAALAWPPRSGMPR